MTVAGVPAFIDNNLITRTNTVQVLNNTVTDLSGATAVAFALYNTTNALFKHNKALRIRSSLDMAIGYQIDYSLWLIMIYNVASRTNTGFYFDHVVDLDVYNTTVHDCNLGFYSKARGTFRNIALSSYPDTALYRNSYGFYADGVVLDVDYAILYGLTSLVESGSVIEGGNVSEKQILYQNEPADDLTPDPISVLTHVGTDNPYTQVYFSIGGIESPVRGELSTDHMYHYDLMDNTFWSVDENTHAEVALIKALQSRVIANAELALTTAIRDYYLKTMESTLGYSERWPTYAYYADAYTFSRRVMDLWFATQNPGTVQAYQNAIGGYNLLPSFFKRQWDDDDYWNIGSHIINLATDPARVLGTSWLPGGEGQRYGITIDVLGYSTLSSSAFKIGRASCRERV